MRNQSSLLISGLIGILLLFSVITSYSSNYLFSAQAQKSTPIPMTTKASTHSSNSTSVSVSNSSSISPSKVGQPTSIGNVTQGKLEKPKAFLDLAHPRVLHPPLEKNPTAVTNLRKQLLGSNSTANKTIITVTNVTNSSSSATTPSRGNSSNTSSMGVTSLGSTSMSAGLTNTSNSLSSARSIHTTHITKLVNKATSGFDGISIVDSGGYIPPDVQIAVGPRHIVEMVNLAGQTWLKQGLSTTPFTLDQFFRTKSDSITDPRVMYDNTTGRWFAAIQDITTDSIHLAVSTTDDPQGNWTVYNFPFSNCPDQPGMAVSNDKLVISVNDFTNHCDGGTFSGAQYAVVDKGDLLTAFPTPRFWQSKANTSDFSVHPAEMIDSPKIYIW